MKKVFLISFFFVVFAISFTPVGVTLANPSWQVETIDCAWCADNSSYIAPHLTGNVHTSYYDYTKHSLKNASRNGSSWKIIEGTETVGKHTSLVLATQSESNITCYDWDNDDLKYTVQNDSLRNIQTVESTFSFSSTSSTSVDIPNSPHINYYHLIYDDLEYSLWNDSFVAPPNY